MKTTEHLALLQKIKTNLNSIKEVDDIARGTSSLKQFINER